MVACPQRNSAQGKGGFPSSRQQLDQCGAAQEGRGDAARLQGRARPGLGGSSGSTTRLEPPGVLLCDSRSVISAVSKASGSEVRVY